MIYIFWSCRDIREAEQIVRELLTKRLIACASLFPEVMSIYLWKGKVESGKEIKVMLKTQAHHFEEIQREITARCSYEVAEIACVDVSRVNPEYASWIIKETAQS